MGFFDFAADPQRLAMMQMGLALAGSQNANFGQALSQAGMFGIGAYQQALDAKDKKRLRDMQEEEARMGLDAKRRDADYQSRLDALAQAQAGSDGAFNWQGYMAGLPALGSRGVEKSLAMQQALAKESGFEKINPKDYTAASIAKFSQSRNYADLVPMRKTETIDLGGKVVTWDPWNTAPGQSLNRSMTPGEAWQRERAMQGEVREVTMPDGTQGLARVGLNNSVTPIMGLGQKRERLHDSAAEKLLQLDGLMHTANVALAELNENKGATGPVMGRLPTVVANWINQGGTKARQFLADLTTQITLARSGAAVTEQEYSRLAPFLAEPTDTPAIAARKLRNLITEYGTIRQNRAAFYEGQGYRVPGAGPGVAIQQPATAAMGGGQNRTPTIADIQAELARRGGG